MDFKPCPFCGYSPAFTYEGWKDENRYVGARLSCCVTMHAGIGWRVARDLTEAQHVEMLRSKLLSEWNTRNGEEARDATRYHLLREQTWDRSAFAVVMDPKKNVRLGTFCPTGPLLDEIIDAALEERISHDLQQ